MNWTSQLHHTLLSGAQVRIDSRKVDRGDVFFALKGDRFNANDFVAEVLAKEPAWVVMDEDRGLSDSRIILVEDSLVALQDLARFHRHQLRIPVIGLTGSNGKTTSKELFHAVLSQKYRVASTVGNLNNHIGVPLTVLSIKPEHQIAVVEMGANAQKEIEFLCSICQPDIGYITNFGLAHLEGFGGPEGVVKGKSELYDYLRAAGKKAIVFSDTPRQIEKSEGIERTLFGSHADPPFQFSVGAELPYFQVHHEGRIIQTQLSGAYNYSNVAAAITMGILFELPIEQIIAAIENYHPTNNRSQKQTTERNTLIVDCYNANPSSMELALRSLAAHSGKRMAILGDMFEMGPYEAEEHQRIANLTSSLGIEMNVFVGKAFAQHAHQEAIRFLTTDEALAYFSSNPPSGYTILLKGSRGMTLEKLIPLL